MYLFDEEIMTPIKAGGTAEQKRMLAEDGLQVEEMASAIADLKHAWQRFRKVDAEPNAALNRNHEVEWFHAVEALGLADSRAKQVFTGGRLDPASLRQYAKWRKHWIEGIGGAWYRPEA